MCRNVQFSHFWPGGFEHPRRGGLAEQGVTVLPGTAGCWTVAGVGVWEMKEPTDVFVLPVHALAHRQEENMGCRQRVMEFSAEMNHW